ncbi:phage baseplate plug family protein [Megamonas hypermegale]|uniref:phage baseplate plug family protein n=1 Tax=Megamonas hypermegale TaxID=158847 RepID=UPI0026F232C4|nr:hypothetical protein [Megamonas hypermegale]
MLYSIPLTTAPNQTFNFKININGSNIHLKIFLRYLEEYKHWVADISNADTNECLIAGLPLVPGNGLAANLLAQYDYIDIGEAYIVKAEQTDLEYPDNKTLGSSFLLLWGVLDE